MKSLLLFFGLFFVSSSIELDDHKYYISLTEIMHNQEDGTVEVGTKVFYDDLEVAIYNIYDKRLRGTEEDNGMIEEYILNHLQLKIDEEIVPISFVGTEDELDAIWIYFEGKLPETVKESDEITIRNTVLTDYFGDQQNIINYFPDKSNQRKVKGFALTRNKIKNSTSLF